MLSESLKNQLVKELQYSAVRSSGPGGQHVNKVSSKIMLRFNLYDSAVLSAELKHILAIKLRNKLTNENELIITVQTSRSQLKNKAEATQKFLNLIEKALTPVKTRRPTKPTSTSKKKRVDDKKQLSQKKTLRRKPDL